MIFVAGSEARTDLRKAPNGRDRKNSLAKVA
jgi:hypothetical protein